MRVFFRHALIGTLLVANSASADFVWGVGGTTKTKSHLGVDLTGSKTDPTVGFFVELMYAGADGIIDTPTGAFTMTPAELAANPRLEFGSGPNKDIRVSVAFYGEGVTGLGLPNGNFTASDVITEDGTLEFDGGKYYIRAWEAPSPAYNGGNYLLAQIPVPLLESSRYYGMSALLTNPGNGGADSSPAIPNNVLVPGVAFTTSSQFTLSAVPEAGTAGLAGLGMLVLRRFLRRKTA
jgi:hypothetical protein